MKGAALAMEANSPGLPPARLPPAQLPPVDSAVPGACIERIAVIVASVGRAEEIGQLLTALARQSLPPSHIVLSVASPADLPPALPPGVVVLMGQAGLTLQRNRGLDHVLGQCDAVIFYDDDFLPAASALLGIKQFFESSPDIVGGSGLVLADGVTGGGLGYDAALRILENFEAQPVVPPRTGDKFFAYGCNMALRAAAITDLRFDENLPLYAWQEDIDFASRVAARGRFVHTTAFAGVHRGVNKARSPGRRLGYSQMVNPVYLVRKGTMGWRKAALIMSKNLVANTVRSVLPEPLIDRRGRLAGNVRGLADIVWRGKADPMAVLSIK
jgi:GT2 family glycosyltransferase